MSPTDVRILGYVAIMLLFFGAADAAQKTKRKGRAARRKTPIERPVKFDAAAVNQATTRDEIGPDAKGNAVVRAQILLDRTHHSPGEIDGHFGDNLSVAVRGYQSARHLPESGKVDAATWEALNADNAPAMVEYTIADDDVKGPFTDVPAGMMEQSKLDKLSFSTPEEGLGERFHIDPKLLAQLNPGKDLKKAGESIRVPNVQREFLVPAERVVVSKSRRTVTAIAPDGTQLAEYPATIGSEHDPLPIGDWKVKLVQQNPWFNYNPTLFYDASPADTKARIAPGPNNPVGVVWIGLTKEHYGIHGTPEPGTIGHTTSHGCIRLTNWDAEELSQMVKPGMPVLLQE